MMTTDRRKDGRFQILMAAVREGDQQAIAVLHNDYCSHVMAVVRTQSNQARVHTQHYIVVLHVFLLLAISKTPATSKKLGGSLLSHIAPKVVRMWR